MRMPPAQKYVGGNIICLKRMTLLTIGLLVEQYIAPSASLLIRVLYIFSDAAAPGLVGRPRFHQAINRGPTIGE